ncbi:MAG: Bug family tripartite tricarboxylate transporter substrate binding protein [Alphaproteobacteria bacterium]
MSTDYFSDKTITVQVPSGSGGTYHVYCQLVQRNIGKYIPGKPKTLIQNRPGSGGAKSASYMANVAPKDGSVIAMIAPGTITTPLVRKVKFDARKFQWLGAPAARAAAIWVWHTHGIKTFKDAQKKEVAIATSGFSSAGSVFPRLAISLLGAKFKLIYGYKGGGAMNLSVEKGETMGRWNFYSGFTGVRPTWIPEGKIIPLIGTGPKHPKLAGVPHFTDLLKEGTTERKLYDLLGMNLEVGQAFYAPPGTPKKVVEILRGGFKAMIADPAFKANVLKRRVEFSPVSVPEIEKKIKNAFDAASSDVLKALRNVYKKKKS